MPDLCKQKAVEMYETLGPPLDVTNVREIGWRRTTGGKSALFYSFSTVQTQEEIAVVQAPTCPKCGETMVQRSGKFGEFYGCPLYPGCKGTRPI